MNVSIVILDYLLKLLNHYLPVDENIHFSNDSSYA